MRKPSFDSLSLRAVATEAAPLLAGGQVQRIRQPDEHTVTLQIHRYPGTHRLLLCAHPERFRAHLTTREYANPPTPPPFCMALRKYLEGGRVQSLAQDGADRVLRLVVDTPHGVLTLVAELMGRHSNIVLVDEGGEVLEAIKRVGPKVSRRVVLPGRPYPPLPASDRPSLWDAPVADLERLWDDMPAPPTGKGLLERFGGVSPFLADWTLTTEDLRRALFDLVAAARAGRFLPTVYRDAEDTPVGAWPFPPPDADADASRAPLSMSEALDIASSSRAADDRRQRLLREALALLDRERDALDRRVADLDRIVHRAEDIETWRIMGELLMANAHAMERGAESVSLTNYYDPEQGMLDIPLDPRLSPRENAEAYFERQRKARAALEREPEQRRALEERIAALQQRREAAESADEAELAHLLEQWRGPEGAGAGKGRRAEPEYPPGVRIRRHTSPDGYTVLVGDNATGNDYLTTRLADPDDLWLHVRAAASAHAVIRTARKPDAVPPATLRFAAERVAARSEAKGSAVIPVDYTLRRYVRKPRGAAPGRVIYEREKTLYVGAAAGE